MLVEQKKFEDTDGSVGYVESIFKSDNVLKSTYFPKARRLYIAFSRGHTYSYSNVSPEMYAEFEDAESQGVFFHKRINNKPNHIARKEFTLYPNEVKELKEIVESRKTIKDEEDE